MKLLSLLYHDVVEGDLASSGFPGADAAVYKLERAVFEEHLETIAERARQPAVSVLEAVRTPGTDIPLLLTFDDGGIAAHSPTAGLLETRESVGHFFVTTDWIGRPGFMGPEEIRELDRRGHIIGSHTCSHPSRMWSLPSARLAAEWAESTAKLSEIVGHEVTVASVPGGYYTRRVAHAAEAAGLRVLFTSEPTLRCHRVGQCLVVGRFNVDQRTSPQTAGALAAADSRTLRRQWAYWNLKKALKATAGPAYDQARKMVFASRRAL